MRSFCILDSIRVRPVGVALASLGVWGLSGHCILTLWFLVELTEGNLDDTVG